MNKELLKKLAKLTAQNKKVDKKISDFVLRKLSKRDLKIYLSYLKNEIKKNQIYVIIADVPDKSLKENLSELFKGRDLEIVTDSTLGAGLRIEFDDNIINANIKDMVAQAVSSLRSNL